MMPEGPMLIISFYSYVLEVVRNSEGKLVEGSTEKPARYRNLWILCRDMEELNPVVAWKVMEVHEVKEELTL
uniref:Tim44-like domain-containing protein n=1 Tax=Plectus sambesii TaxID=2011161 RepID=A0A914VX30_9BILA